MSGSHDLPDEIILEIVEFATPIYPLTGNRIGYEELRNLRLVSKRFHDLLSPLLFSTLRLRFRDPNFSESETAAADYIRSQGIVKALATGTTTVFLHTKRLYLDTTILLPLEDKKDILSTRTFVSDNIYNAICGLKNLRTVNWFSNLTPDTVELGTKINHALGTLSSFQGFEDLHFDSSLTFHPRPSFTLKSFTNLTIFRIHWEWRRPKHLIREIASLLSRCPELTEFSLRYCPSSQRKHITLREIFAEIGHLERPWKLQKLELKSVEISPDDFRAYIHHLKHLTFLQILKCPSPRAATACGGIWNILQQRDIAQIRGRI
ncbi:hypothetical protein AGABI1DRAFT_125567 [Agaricus bisporus var. burnettii JB137-S8]|uniref:F-box domain-containing protein n=1 Tax=Agaricus bisporus var. burnettii (strain JB137-S8 / ATCC MYA-4627 / FGSC 10392) TaxID=597362 RepID=K5XI14_AGABU|nr:uncharacterized protein AGABI1DRAFT_125567 [Agaricus bisporus var. burnettii JB137-S8]EKM83088.1 hypothetical protein AGABI1DRAFT_125567 [Agaricus bisporus var. burnettii JB137-S8]